MKLALTLPAPSDPKLAAELTRIVSELEGDVRPRQVLPAAGGLGTRRRTASTSTR